MKKIFYSLCCIILASCGTDEAVVEKTKEKNDSSFTLEAKHLVVKDAKDLTDAKGILGIFFVPEMLTVTKMDSANMYHVTEKMTDGFVAVNKDIAFMKAHVNGSPGIIYYNSDSANFVFECVVPIEQMPKVEPKNSKIVILEEGNMLIYNYYGDPEGLYNAYGEMQEYCKTNNLQHIGPMREFYITDGSTQPDKKQWLTRIMLPVKGL
ncbi:MAG: GyrI-like domain-containing protein [Sphingobacteriaceae bacterium]|nr:GyrI-like domain-containing protein [Sphingobacteriaceae bacterium]